ncbi:DUF4935 domain-containing protein [Nocardia cyriacigeorgica]|uniref:PIN domain-containing protein n=1 Tax=Nocardia cyriacigeorgica TaxID=135487 RepID=UPI001893732D|nr:PIN domain-containing protein [Nocardia cyriacigeorgica]MBF6083878.1 DUF4935 domain-containing protein [Nocardia cyriacigeorgica]
MPIIIVVDANIVVSSPRLRSAAWKSLIDHRDAWNLQFVVPEVAVMEIVKNVREMWDRERKALAKLKVAEFGLTVERDGLLHRIDAQIDGYELELHDRLKQIGARIASPPSIDHMDIARRASDGRAPFSAKNKDCYRDTLIWHSVVDIAQSHPSDEVWFLSDNTQDFGGTIGNREDCPILLHPDLVADSTRYGVSSGVQYVASTNSLEQHLAARFAPISSDKMRQRIDLNELNAKFKADVVGLDLSPRDAALAPSTLAATVAAAEPATESWVFMDGARRDDSGWTARFTVTATTLYARSDPVHSLKIEHKTLAFTGGIAITEGGTITELGFAAAEALPDDPMRDLWTAPKPSGRSAQYERTADEIRRILNNSSPFDNQKVLFDTIQGMQQNAAAAFRDAGIQEQLQQNAAAAFRDAGIQEQLQQNAAAAFRDAGIQEQLQQNAAAAFRGIEPTPRD